VRVIVWRHLLVFREHIKNPFWITETWLKWVFRNEGRYFRVKVVYGVCMKVDAFDCDLQLLLFTTQIWVLSRQLGSWFLLDSAVFGRLTDRINFYLQQFWGCDMPNVLNQHLRLNQPVVVLFKTPNLDLILNMQFVYHFPVLPLRPANTWHSLPVLKELRRLQHRFLPVVTHSSYPFRINLRFPKLNFGDGNHICQLYLDQGRGVLGKE
jgi:hypothetical protein